MFRPRVIPCLTILEGGLVKTQGFKNPKYVGDPINAVKIFNDMEVDELFILDIGATKKRRGPQLELLEEIASEAFMPICYGGGITTFEQVEKIFYLGYEKVALNTQLYGDLNFVTQIAKIYGHQSVVASIDIKKNFFGKYKAFNSNVEDLPGDLLEFITKLEDRGVGEFVIQSVDRDGMMKGYDLEIIEKIANKASVPVVCMGGAGSLQDIKQVLGKGVSAAAASSIFVFEGKHRAVLISYFDPHQLQELENT